MPVITITITGERITPLQHLEMQQKTIQMMAETTDRRAPMKQETEQPKRRTDGSLDIDHYVKLSRSMRAGTYARWWKQLWWGLSRISS